MDRYGWINRCTYYIRMLGFVNVYVKYFYFSNQTSKKRGNLQCITSRKGSVDTD